MWGACSKSRISQHQVYQFIEEERGLISLSSRKTSIHKHTNNSLVPVIRRLCLFIALHDLDDGTTKTKASRGSSDKLSDRDARQPASFLNLPSLLLLLLLPVLISISRMKEIWGSSTLHAELYVVSRWTLCTYRLDSQRRSQNAGTARRQHC